MTKRSMDCLEMAFQKHLKDSKEGRYGKQKKPKKPKTAYVPEEEEEEPSFEAYFHRKLTKLFPDVSSYKYSWRPDDSVLFVTPSGYVPCIGLDEDSCEPYFICFPKTEVILQKCRNKCCDASRNKRDGGKTKFVFDSAREAAKQHRAKEKKKATERNKKEAQERKTEEITPCPLAHIQSGNKKGSIWWLQNVCDNRVVISDDEVHRWREDIAIWERVRKQPQRIVADTLWEHPEKIDVGKYTVATSLWNHSMTALTRPKEDFSDLLNKKCKNLLPIANNLCIDLRTGRTIPRKREHMFTFATKCTYIPPEQRDTLLQNKLIEVLMQICCERKDLLDYMQVAFGYSITGETNAQVFFLWLGKAGSNGKGFLGRALRNVLSNFLTGVKKQVIISSGYSSESAEGPSPHTMALKEGRFAMTTEVIASDTFKIDSILRITGEDLISARGLHKEKEDFRTQDKLHAQVNDCPQVDTSHKAFLRRFVILLFEATFVPKSQVAEKQKVIDRYNELVSDGDQGGRIATPEYRMVFPLDPTLENRFKSDGDLFNYFFSWLVDGALIYYQEGPDFIRNPPECLKNALTSSVGEQDVVGIYISERIKLTKEHIQDRVTPNDLHKDFLRWYKQHVNNSDAKGMKKKDFSRDLLKKGWVKTPYKGIVYWRGVRMPKM
jgi:phage/plasmid-associated DNA primase